MSKNILWITNALIGHHREMMGLDHQVSGATWLHAAYKAALGNKDYQLHIATIGDVKKTIAGSKDGHCFYILPGGQERQYDIQSNSHYNVMFSMRSFIKPAGTRTSTTSPTCFPSRA